MHVFSLFDSVCVYMCVAAVSYVCVYIITFSHVSWIIANFKIKGRMHLASRFNYQNNLITKINLLICIHAVISLFLSTLFTFLFVVPAVI